MAPIGKLVKAAQPGYLSMWSAEAMTAAYHYRCTTGLLRTSSSSRSVLTLRQARHNRKGIKVQGPKHHQKPADLTDRCLGRLSLTTIKQKPRKGEKVPLRPNKQADPEGHPATPEVIDSGRHGCVTCKPVQEALLCLQGSAACWCRQ